MCRPLAVIALLAAALCPLGTSAAPVAPVQVVSELSTRNVRSEESSLADVVLDAVRAVERTDVALASASAFAETTVPKGSARADDLAACLANRDDTVVVVKLTGAQLRKALEKSLALYPQKNVAFLQVSGMVVNIDPAGEKDRRIISVKVAKAALDDARTYTVAMPAPLANGALAYGAIWGRADIDHDTMKSLADALGDYLGTVKAVGGKSEERLVVKR